MLKTLRRVLSGHREGERGQMLIMALLLMVVGLGAIVVSVDAGYWLRDRRDAQNDADAAALAGAQELPDTVAAEDAVYSWAAQNGLEAADVREIQFEDRNADGEMDLVRVRVRRGSDALMAQVFGVGDPDVGATAAAATVYVEGACIMPWGIIAGNPDPEDHYGLVDLYGEDHLYIFQLSGEFADDSPGNFGAISVYGEGKNVYKESILGSCEVKNNACTSDPMVFVNETLSGCTSEPGGGGAITANTLDERYAPSMDDECDAASYEEAIALASPGSGCLERAVPIAIISSLPGQGSGDITVYGIATFYIADWSKSRTCFPDGRCGYVWGYLLNNVPAVSAQVAFTEEFIPFAPTGVALVE